MRRVGVLMSTAADDPESQLRLVAFVQGCSRRAEPSAAQASFGRVASLVTDQMALRLSDEDGNLAGCACLVFRVWRVGCDG
jgi:hypothetical protein